MPHLAIGGTAAASAGGTIGGSAAGSATAGAAAFSFPVAPFIIGSLVVGQLLVGRQQARAFRANARTLRQQAADALLFGQIEAERIRRSGERVQGDLRATVGVAGVELSGSPLAVAVDLAIEIDREARVTLFNAERQAASLEAEARAQRRAAKSATRISGIQAATTFLTGGTRLGVFG